MPLRQLRHNLHYPLLPRGPDTAGDSSDCSAYCSIPSLAHHEEAATVRRSPRRKLPTLFRAQPKTKWCTNLARPR